MKGKEAEESYREAMGRFATGVTVIAAGWGERLHAMTANAVASLSLDPIRLLVCVGKGSHCLSAIEREGAFSVNVLREDQAALSVYFSGYWQGGGAPGFRFSLWQDCPRLNGAIAALACRVARCHDGGDHVIVTGEVTGVYAGSSGKPLLYMRGRYHGLGPEITRPDRRRKHP